MLHVGLFTVKSMLELSDVSICRSLFLFLAIYLFGLQISMLSACYGLLLRFLFFFFF